MTTVIGGSPPHMRGTLERTSPYVHITGITPAHAGNTILHKELCSKGWDHPRTCGEHNVRNASVETIVGSPPHMRGTRYPLPVRRSDAGITPAHAGNTSSTSRAIPQSWDHPRTCGEHSFLTSFNTFALGSPPHMRGTLLLSTA